MAAEKAATRFNTIDPSKDGEQPLTGKLVPYNFDQMQAGSRTPSTSRSRKASASATFATRARRSRDDQAFVVVTNSYRANGGGDFPGMNGESVVINAPDGNREVVIKWVEGKKTITRRDVDKRSWHFVPVKTRGPLTFTAAAGKEDVAKAQGLAIRQLRDNGDGTALYSLDLLPPTEPSAVAGVIVIAMDVPRYRHRDLDRSYNRHDRVPTRPSGQCRPA